ncbi:sigma-70 family RNA polymerase sigma factor [Stenotrophomonas pictorum]|nr:sigma-70 family RNA polymerase sigma factor [Stenotrophomonas pictorum]
MLGGELRAGTTPLSVAMLDLDHFGQTNATHGHAGGDQALRHLVAVIQHRLCGRDHIARLGGDEFVLVLPELGRGAALETVQQLQTALVQRPFLHEDQRVQVRFSAGVASAVAGETADALLQRATVPCMPPSAAAATWRSWPTERQVGKGCDISCAGANHQGMDTIMMAGTSEDLQQRFAALLAQHQGIVLKVARAYCHDSEERRDLLQEISIQAWRAFPAFAPERAQFSTWLYRIALNVAISQLRHQRLRLHHHHDVDAARIDDLAAVADSAEDAASLAQLNALIRSLPALDRALLLLHLDDCSHRQISEVLGLSPGNIATRLHRLRQQLRQRLNPSPDR